MKNRLLAWLLALCLMTAIPAGALAEEAVSAPVEAEVAESESLPLGVEESAANGEAEVSGEEPLEAGENAAEAGAQSLAEDGSFVEGLAVVCAEGNTLWDDEGNARFENLPVGTVLYAAFRYGEQKLQVAFDEGGALAWGWMAPQALRSATDAEASEAIAAAKDDAGALWLEDTWPLTRLCSEEAVSGVAPEDAEVPLEAASVSETEAPADAGNDAPRRLSVEALTLATGDQQPLWVDGTDEVPVWFTGDESVAEISAEGVLTALTPGTTAAFASFADGEVLSCEVTVLSSDLAAISFAQDTLSLGVKEESYALATILDQNGLPVDVAVSYTTDKSKYVSVDGSGRIKGLKKGSARITARTADGLTATCAVTVLKAPSKVTVSPASMMLGVGQTGQAFYTLPSKTAGAVTWSSSNEGVAVVDPMTGAVEAVSMGTATLTARTFNKKSKSLKLTVLDAPESVFFDSEFFSVGAGQTVTLDAHVNTGAFGEMSYTSSDESVAFVNGDELTGVQEGTAIITATAYNGVTATCEVTVQPAPEYVSLPFQTLLMGLKDECQLEPDAGGATDWFVYHSSKPKVVSVNRDGLLRALKKGTSTITVKTYNGLSCRVTVTVKAAPGSVTAVPRSMSLDVGETAVVGYKLPKNTGGVVKFMSSDESVLTVDPVTGEVTALASGEADVMLRTYNNRTDTCHVQVYGAPAAIALEESDFEIGAGESVQLKPLFPDGGHALVMYESQDPDVAEVSGDGVVTGLSAGRTLVYVYAGSRDVYAVANVRVWDAPDDVRLPETEKSMTVNDTLTLKPIIPTGSRTTFTYETSDENVASVDEGGVVKAVGGGETVITVTTHNGRQATIVLTVLDPWYPESIELLEEVPELTEGDTWQVRYAVEPRQAAPNLEWTTSRKSVATVDDEGVITAVSSGEATIKAVSRKNPDLVLTIPVTVVGDSGSLTMVIPARTTQEDGIEENLEKIDAVRRSAISEIDRLKSAGTISSSDASKRREMVNNIFENYAFPWKTKKLQKYWKAANSEGGVKDFKTDRVYYGLPYISGSGSNRHYDVELALDEDRYYDSGEGYYILNQNKLLGGKYVGNDCSGLVNVSIWGTSSKRASDRTDDIASSKYYTTISDFKAMRPGDLICKSSAHVVMFLYYVNADKTRFMMIENGGAEPGTNTVHCDIYDASYYTSRGYRVRRLADLD